MRAMDLFDTQSKYSVASGENEGKSACLDVRLAAALMSPLTLSSATETAISEEKAVQTFHDESAVSSPCSVLSFSLCRAH